MLQRTAAAASFQSSTTVGLHLGQVGVDRRRLTLLHQDFPEQPVIRFLQAAKKPLYITDVNWDDKALGSGWSWDDYSSSYMAERSPLPVYGNVIRWIQERDTSVPVPENILDQQVFTYSIPDVSWPVKFTPDLGKRNFSVERDKDAKPNDS